MGLDNGALAKSALDHVWINGSLYQEINGADLLCFLFKNTDELFTDDLKFSLRPLHACQFFIESLLGIDTDEVKIVGTVWTEDRFHLISLVFA